MKLKVQTPGNPCSSVTQWMDIHWVSLHTWNVRDAGDSCVQGRYGFAYIKCLNDASEKAGVPTDDKNHFCWPNFIIYT